MQTTQQDSTKESNGNTSGAMKKEHFGWIMALYLIGLFVGALNMGTITPVRTIIQGSLGVNDATGIWMINIYTLCYAAVIPFAGKMADRYGRKYVFVISIALFCIGSIVCGIAEATGSFAVLIAGRIIQALGGGGIMPIATAEFGTSFPEEKRGMALGLVGGVYGIASVLGATVGSAILDLFGATQWQWVFYFNVPFCLFIIIGSLVFIPNHKAEVTSKIDKLGTLLMTLIILSLLYGLKNIDFFDFLPSLAQSDVWPFLVIVIVLIPLFVFTEKRADDPIFHMEYLSNRQIAITLVLAALVGASMMGMIFIPQFAENALKMPAGDGGYFVIILGLCAGLGSPASGTLIDRFGSKVVLALGFLVSVIGCLFLALVATQSPSLVTVIISLVVIGLGMGFAMGTPLNYMMMQNTKDEESNSALATLSLVRSIGTAIAPAIMVGFIVQASSLISTQLMENMPEIPQAPALEQTTQLKTVMDKLEASSPEAAEMFDGMDIDAMLSMDMDMDMNSGNKDLTLPDELLTELQASDVTTIVEITKHMATWMFDSNVPDVIVQIQDGINEGIDGVSQGISGIDEGINEMKTGIEQMSAMSGTMGSSMGGSMGDMGSAMGSSMGGSSTGMSMPSANMGDSSSNATGNAMGSSMGAMGSSMGDMGSSMATMGGAGVADMSGALDKMKDALASMQEQRDLLDEAKGLMGEIRDEIPTVFADVEQTYLSRIDDESDTLEGIYQTTLNGGYRNMYLCVAAFNLLGFLILLFYKEPKREAGAAPAGHGHKHGHGSKQEASPELQS